MCEDACHWADSSCFDLRKKYKSRARCLGPCKQIRVVCFAEPKGVCKKCFEAAYCSMGVYNWG